MLRNFYLRIIFRNRCILRVRWNASHQKIKMNELKIFYCIWVCPKPEIQKPFNFLVVKENVSQSPKNWLTIHRWCFSTNQQVDSIHRFVIILTPPSGSSIFWNTVLEMQSSNAVLEFKTERSFELKVNPVEWPPLVEWVLNITSPFPRLFSGTFTSRPVHFWTHSRRCLLCGLFNRRTV